MKTAVVIGSTGLIGSILVQKLAQDGSWSQVLAICRKQTVWQNPKIRTLLFDFTHWDSFDVQIKSFAGMNTSIDFFCALGTTLAAAGSEEAFKKIDLEATIQFVKMAKRCKAERVIVVSALGANQNSSQFYLKTKGEMEQVSLSLHRTGIYFLRPSLLLGDRTTFRFFERLAIIAFPLYSFFLVGPLKKYRPVSATAVAKVMVDIAAKKTAVATFVENEDILNWKF